MNIIHISTCYFLIATMLGCKHQSSANTKDVVGDGQPAGPVVIERKDREPFAAVKLSPYMLDVLRKAPGGYDESQHCIRVVNRPFNPAVRRVTIEWSASGPCKNELIESQKIIARFAIEFGQTVVLPYDRINAASSNFWGIVSDFPNINDNIILDFLCSGSTTKMKTSDGSPFRFDNKCRIVLRKGKLCDVIRFGEKTKPECQP